MKIKGEKVELLVIGNGQIYTKKGIKLKDNVIIAEDGRGYLRTARMNNSLEIFLQANLERGNGNIPVEQIYQRYFDFCNAYGMDILPFDKFVKALSKYIEINEVLMEEKNEKGESVQRPKLIAKGVALVNKTITIDGNGNDVYFLTKKGLLGKKKIPVYVIIEGVPKTVSFNEVKGVGVDGFGTLRVVDDVTMGQLLTETMLMGATIGTQKFFRMLQILMLVCVVISILASVFGLINFVYISKITQAVHTVQTQVNTLIKLLGGMIK